MCAHGDRKSFHRLVALVNRDNTEEGAEECDEEEREHTGNFLVNIEVHTHLSE